MGAGFTKLSSWFVNGKEEMQIVMVGLDCSGKTTILNKLKLGENFETTATIGFNLGTIEYKDVSFHVMDVGGQGRQMQFLWRNFLYKRRAIIYVVDSNDKERIVVARDDLHMKLNEEEALRDVILLVLANKQDLPNAMNADEITDQLDLRSLTHHPWYIQSTCATSGEGLNEGFEWLYNNLANKNN